MRLTLFVLAPFVGFGVIFAVASAIVLFTLHLCRPRPAGAGRTGVAPLVTAARATAPNHPQVEPAVAAEVVLERAPVDEAAAARAPAFAPRVEPAHTADEPSPGPLHHGVVHRIAAELGIAATVAYCLLESLVVHRSGRRDGSR